MKQLLSLYEGRKKDEPSCIAKVIMCILCMHFVAATSVYTAGAVLVTIGDFFPIIR